MTKLSQRLRILTFMHRLLTLTLILIGLLLASCRPADPESGMPLGIAEQVAVRAFQQMNPTVLAWDSLMPADYQPSYQQFPWAVEDGESLMQETLQQTPLVEELNGQEVKVSGYVVPLDSDETSISEFLLVPFLGACTHVPPPPANQIVYVKPTYPLLFDESWDVISVVGTLSTEGRTSEFGAVGYQMIDSFITKFDETEYAGIAETPVVVDGVGGDTPLPLLDR